MHVQLDPPGRVADVYVFCLHEPDEATNKNVRDPANWTFWVVSRRRLDDQLGPQKSVGLATLGSLARRIQWSGLKAAVDACIEEVRK